MSHNSKPRRKYLVLVGLTAKGVLAGCTGGEDNDDERDDGDNDPNREEDNPSDNINDEGDDDGGSEVEDPIEPKVFSGNGSEVIQNVELGGGLIIAEVDHEPVDDISNILVKLVDANGDGEWIVFQDRHGRSGRGANVVEEGEYHIEVEGDGEWSISVSQPRVSEENAETPPIEISGSKSDVVGPYLFDGRYIAEASHTGDLDIIVTVWPMEGPWGDFEIPIMEAGEGTFESTFSFDGIAWIHVEADEDWSLSIE